MHAAITTSLTLEGGNSKISFDNLFVDKIKLVNLEGNSGECVECLHTLHVGDKVAIFMLSEVDKGREISLPIKHVKLCHVYEKDGNFCLEDFINRVLQGYRIDEIPKNGTQKLNSNSTDEKYLADSE